MKNEKINDILDRLSDANAMLEMCRGYTQSDEPHMKTLDIALYNLLGTYEKIYEQLLTGK